jgi:ketosteroid isomerase-like protein
MSSQSIPEILKGVFDAFNEHDLDRIMSHFVDDCVLEMPRGPDPWGKRYIGHVAVREALASRFAGLPDVQYSEDSHFVSGDTGISKWTVRGTATNNQVVEVHGCDFYTFRGGKIIKKDSYWKIREP